MVHCGRTLKKGGRKTKNDGFWLTHPSGSTHSPRRTLTHTKSSSQAFMLKSLEGNKKGWCFQEVESEWETSGWGGRSRLFSFLSSAYLAWIDNLRAKDPDLPSRYYIEFVAKKHCRFKSHLSHWIAQGKPQEPALYNTVTQMMEPMDQMEA